MIRLEYEQLMPLREVPDWLFSRSVKGRKGGALGLRTIYDWAKAGKLEVVIVAGRRYTSAEALQRMADRSVPPKILPFPPPCGTPGRKRRGGTRREDRAREDYVDRELLTKHGIG